MGNSSLVNISLAIFVCSGNCKILYSCNDPHIIITIDGQFITLSRPIMGNQSDLIYTYYRKMGYTKFNLKILFSYSLSA